MRPLSELVNTADPAMPLVRQWIAEAELPCEVLPAGPNSGDVLFNLQITTRAPLGAVAYETGGILIDHGWVRLLGSGNPRLTRDLYTWNALRSDGFLLIGDDAIGGFFALNGGGLGSDLHRVYYWPPDGLDWQALKLGYTEFLQAFLTKRVSRFYSDLRWPTWKTDISSLTGDRCLAFYPFLWTSEGSIKKSHRAEVSTAEAFDLKADIRRQIAAGDA